MLRLFTGKLILLLLLQIAMSGILLAQPHANFTISNPTGCSPQVENFTNTSTGTGLTYNWDLGNGNTSLQKDAGGIYNTQKVYSITLTVTDASKKTDVITKTVTIYGSPVAAFKADVTLGCPPFPVTFTDQSTAGSSAINNWTWDFGDGGSDKKQNPAAHTYTATGNYDVSLVVTDANGCQNSAQKKAFIVVTKPPAIDFTSSVPGGCVPPVAISFNPTVTSPNSPFTYAWDFGDGNTNTTANPNNTYKKAGLFDVKLSVTDKAGCSSSVLKSGFIFIGKPQADFTFSPASGCAPLEVNFNDNSSGLDAGATYWWDFGDGTNGTGSSPNHKYAIGSYSVTYGVQTGSGCRDTIVKNGIITVTKGFKASFTADSILCQGPFKTTFINTSGPGTNVVLWDFGDGTSNSPSTSSQSTPTHTYVPNPNANPPLGPLYSVTLTVSDANGCVEQWTENNMINAQQITTAINATTFAGCVPFDFVFTGAPLSNDSIASVAWDFGDGNKSTLAQPGHHLFKDTGIFNIKMSVTSLKGCKATSGVIVKVGTPPVANFTSQPDSGCLNKLRHVHFTNLTNTVGKIKADTYQWDFGDGTTSQSVSPSHKYEIKPGRYDVRLIALNKGCADTILKPKLIIVAGPWAQYTTTSSGCISNTITFHDTSIDANRVSYNFGDGSPISTLRDPIHTYIAGTFHPYQIVYNDTFGCTDTFTGLPIAIKKPWVVSLTSDVKTGCWPLTVFFTVNDNDSADNTIYFGDGSSITTTSIDTPQRIIPHIYPSKGTYKPLLVAVNTNKCPDSVKLGYNIVTNGPSVNFATNITGGCVPLKIILYDSSTKDKTIKSKMYDMGDGNIIKVLGDTMSYTYKTAPPDQFGGYVITEEVMDTASCTNTFTQTVYPSEPVADFIIDSNITCKSLIYSFNPTDVGLGPFSYRWDLGNGTIDSSDRSPLVIYKNGSYKVHLRMIDNNGCKDSIVRTILVRREKSKASFSVDSSIGNCPPFHVAFHDHSVFAFGGFRQYEWDFGDGSPISSLSDPQKEYFNAGTFSIKLKITDSLGCSDSVIVPNLIKVKGAIGTYTVSRVTGCVPTTVHFVAISTNASKFEWDMGDGNLENGDTLTYTYSSPRIYIPQLLLTDSFGCRYGLPALDTIVVDSLPVPAFTFDSLCSGLPTHFHDMSAAGSGYLTNWVWDFGDGGSGTGPNPIHAFRKNGYYTIAIGVTNSDGCFNKDTNKIKIGGITAAFSSARKGCVGTAVQFSDSSNSDTTVKSWTWLFGDGDSSFVQNPLHMYPKKGIYTVSLFVMNQKGCVDSLVMKNYIIIGDTIPPPPPVLYRVSVLNDNQVEVDFSHFQDVDFDHYDIWMEDQSGNFQVIDHIANLNDTIYTANVPGTLHNVYCFKVESYNICGHHSQLSTSQCSINLTATPGPDEAVLNWTPYVGWGVKKYRIYRESFYTPGEYVLLDSVPGNTLNYIDSTVICYKPATYKIMAVEDSANVYVSWSDTSTTLPVHINKVPAANMLRVTVPDNKVTQIDWKDTATIKVKKWMVEKSLDGITYFPLDSPFNRNILSVKDPKVDVHHKSYYYRVNMMDSCGDLGPFSHIGKSILLGTDTTADVRPYLHWSPYTDWPEGVQYYEIQLRDAYNNYHYLASTGSGKDTEFTDLITDRNSLPAYCYRIIAHRNGTAANPNQNANITSMSNEACLNVKSRVFVPNAFTPNKDDLNDSFKVQGLYIREYEIQIYDRWGAKVFESSSLNDNWDGTYKNVDNGIYQKTKPLMDVYKYLIHVRGVDNEVYYLTGWITVLP